MAANVRQKVLLGWREGGGTEGGRWQQRRGKGQGRCTKEGIEREESYTLFEWGEESVINERVSENYN